MKKLQNRLLYIVLVGVIGAAILTGVTTLFSFSTAEKRNSEEMLMQKAKESAVYFNGSFTDVEDLVTSLGNYFLNEIPSMEIFSDVPKRETYIEEMKELSKVMVVHNEDIGAFYFRINPKLADSTTGFFISKEDGKTGFQEFPPTNLTKYDPDDIERVGWYYLPVKAGKPIWIGPYYNKNNAMLMVSYVQPLYYGREQQLIGVVGIDLNFTNLKGKMGKIKAYRSGYATLLNADGEVIYSPKDPVLTDELVNNIIKSEKKEFFTSYIRKQQKYAVASCYLENGNYLLLSAPYAELYEARMKSIYTIVLIILLVTIFIVLTFTQLMQKVFLVASQDTLTNALNKNSYLEHSKEIDEELKSNPNKKFGVVIFDINALKRVNDELGHLQGDNMIQNAYSIIRQYIVGNNNLYRIGGDEFIVIVEDSVLQMEVNLRDFQALMHSRMGTYEIGSKDIVVSSGMAVYTPGEDHSFEDVFKRADQAMYREKARFYAENPKMDRRK